MSPPSLREHVVETVAVAERPLRLEDIKGVFRRRGSELRVSSGLLGRLARLGRLAESGDGLWTTGDGGAERLAVHGRGELRDLSRAVDATLRRNPARKTGWKDALAGDLRRWWRRVLWTGDLDGLAELQAARRRWAPEREEPWAEVLCRPWLPEVARSLPLDVVDTVAHIDLDAVLAGRRDTFDPGWWTWLSEHPRPSPHMAAIAALRAVLEGDPTGAEGWLARAHDPGLHRQVHGLVHLQHGRLDLARDGLQHATFDVTLRLRPLLSDGPAAADGHPLDLLVAVLQAHWQQRPAPDVRQASERMRQLGLHWVAAELSGRSSTGTAALRSLKTPAPDWSRTLQKLTEVAGPSSGADSRIIWRVRWGPDVSVDCTPRLQRRNARGAFSAGRAISVADILAGRVPAADARDHAIAESRVTVDEFSLRFDPDACWRALVGHPRLFDSRAPTRTLDIRAVSPRLRVSELADGGVSVRPEPSPAPGTRVQVVQAAKGVLDACFFTETQAELAHLLGSGLEVPDHGRDQLARTLQQLVPRFTVLDATGLAAGPESRRVDADPRPVVRLIPFEAGLAATVGVRPLGDLGPLPAAGQGPPTLSARTRAGSLWTRRQLHSENDLHQAMIARIPTLAYADPEQAIEFHSLQSALELLEKLYREGDRVRVEWPEGKPLELLLTDNGALQVTLDEGSGIDWFEASAELKVDGLDADLARLLELLGSATGRFVRLDGRRFLALTEKVRQQLALLERIAQPTEEGLQIHAGAVHLLDELVTTLPDTAPAPLGHIDPPSTLQATLRPYQLDGFRWLARLSHLGLGAVLADDMGLGKTIQTLGLLLHQRATGPALVIGPTSVEGNWVAEARRFAPSLRTRRLRDGDRAALLADLGEGDLVVGTYGLLLSMRVRLSHVRWGTVVLDEAQNIKNADTQVHAAACALQARHRLALTGTPIENHLDELWAQFQFLQPGLLGDRKAFRLRFSEPIRRRAPAPAATLRRLIKPYILRRTKGEVLRDLPPRTDIDLRVDLSAAERAIYDELRKRAEQELEDAGERMLPKLLRWLTRLKQAACHPGLVDERFRGLEGAKERALSQTIDELRASGHRALVFSQYVRHLKVLEARLVRDGVACLYLDGSTPGRQREERVRRFQTGVGDVFLISLKAGGSGLNLTGADHVIHMDPWWNPAVEDQASDRAHRIGQHRPVTVLRFVAAGTIDERILRMHQDKRALAAQVLEDAAEAGRLTETELWRLIRG